MTIQIDIRDNKVLRNTAGEILRTPLLLDVSSSYGVVKNASNEVESVKDKTRPIKALAPVANKPIESGDGFNFSLKTRSSLYNPRINYLENTIEFWFKAINNTAQSMLIGCYNFSDSSDQFYIRITSSGQIGIVSVSSGSVLYLNVIIGAVPIIDVDTWKHFILYNYEYNGQPHCAMYIDGKAYLTYYSTNTNRTYPNTPFTIGNIFGHNNAFKGSMDSIKVGKLQMSSLINAEGSGSTRYAADEQVFTPLTFPNTIL